MPRQTKLSSLMRIEQLGHSAVIRLARTNDVLKMAGTTRVVLATGLSISGGEPSSGERRRETCSVAPTRELPVWALAAFALHARYEKPQIDRGCGHSAYHQAKGLCGW